MSATARRTKRPKRKKVSATVTAQVRQVVKAGQGWCRANMHTWQNPKQRGGALTVDHGVVRVKFVCANCEGERHDAISLASGELVARAYIMPKGYVLKIGNTGDRPSKSDWRREHYKALVGGGK